MDEFDNLTSKQLNNLVKSLLLAAENGGSITINPPYYLKVNKVTEKFTPRKRVKKTGTRRSRKGKL